MKFLKTLIILNILCISLYSSQFITIGTGGVTGTYYPTGSAVCKLFNLYKSQTKIRCSVESTGGSVYNVAAVQNKELDFAIAQSDVLYQAVNGTATFKNKPLKKLKSIMAIYPELLTLVTRKDAHINTLKDIKNKRINLGNPGSGNEATALALFKENRIKKTDLKLAGDYEAIEMPDALKQNKIDGYFYMVGHPTANIKDAANSVDVKIVPLTGIKINNLIKKYPYFAKANIPAGMYLGNSKDIPTFGVKAVLFSSSDVSEKEVYTIVKAVLENFDAFKKLHPAYSNITKKSLLDGLSAPLHEGAKKYYLEAGLL